jgi:hypothetical protein
MNLSLLLFLVGILGFILNRKNIILMLISIKIMLLVVTFLILISSYNLDDNQFHSRIRAKLHEWGDTSQYKSTKFSCIYRMIRNFYKYLVNHNIIGPHKEMLSILGYISQFIFIGWVMYKTFNMICYDKYFLIYFIVALIAAIISDFIFKILNNSDNIYILYLKTIVYYLIYIIGLIFLFIIYLENLGSKILCQPEDNLDSSNNNGSGSSKEDSRNSMEIKSQKNPVTGEDELKGEFKLNKKDVREGLKSGVVEGIKTVAPAIGGSAAGGALGTAVFTNTANLPMGPRIALSGAAIGVGTMSAVLGTTLGKRIMENKEEAKKIKDPINTSSTSNDRSPSPDDNYNSFSVLENNESVNMVYENSPIQYLLSSILGFCLFSGILNIFFLYQLINKYLIKSNLDWILKCVDKYAPIKYKDFIKLRLQSLSNSQNKFSLIFCVIIFIFICLIWSAIIFICSELLLNIDDYCLVHMKLYSNSNSSNINCIFPILFLPKSYLVNPISPPPP